MQHKITRFQIDAATQALEAVLTFTQPADVVLSAYFRAQRNVGSKDRQFVAEAVYGVIRHLRQLHRFGGNNIGARKLLIAWLMRCLGLSIRQLEELISAAEREWLSSAKANAPEAKTLAERCDLPDWLSDQLALQYDEAAQMQLADALNQPAPLDIRVNPLKAEREQVEQALREQGLDVSLGSYSPYALRLPAGTPLHKNPLFLDGTIEVQDEGSQLLAVLLAPKRGEMVVDFCAGAGGKTLLLGGLMRNTGRLYAFDIAEKRLARMKPRLARAGLFNVHPTLLAHENDVRVKRLAGKIDRVLVDAPCSGIGTLRRNPDLKWRQSLESVAQLNVQQASILTSAARLVKPGGRLVYATCSLLQSENDKIIFNFLSNNPDFAEESVNDLLAAQKIDLAMGARLRMNPAEHGTDGFFAAVLTRKT